MDKINTKTYKRRNYFIDREFQAKFILKFCALVALGGLLTIVVLYFLAMKSTTVSIVDSRVVARTTADFILPILIQTVFIVMIIVSMATVIVTLFVSHKIAGPLFRLKKTMQALQEGNFSSDFHIRDLDQLQELADVVNSMIKKVRDGLNGLKTGFLSLKEKLDSISEQEVSQNKQKALGESKKILEEINKSMEHFKT